MQKPVTRHRELQVHVVHTITPFPDLRDDRCHAGMRHVSFDTHGCSPHQPSFAIAQRYLANRCGAHDRRVRPQAPLDAYLVPDSRLSRARADSETADQ